MAKRWSTGPSKKPWICAACRSTLMMRSAPAALKRSATRRARDRLAAAALLVLPGVRVERRDHGDALGGRPLERVDHDELLHEPLVDRRGVRLDHEDVAAADALVEARVDLAVGEGARIGRHELGAELARRSRSASAGCARPDDEHEPLLVRWSRFPDDVVVRSSSTVCRLRVSRPSSCGPDASPRLGRLAAAVPGRLRLDPSLDVALRGHVDGQRARRHVLADDRAGAGVGPVANPNGRDEHVVRPGAHVRRRSRCGACRRRRSWR